MSNQTPIDPFEELLERAFRPGYFVTYRDNWDFVSNLETVETGLALLIDADATRATRLYATFIAACYEKSEEIDDSSGAFGELVKELFLGWIKARQAAHMDPEETINRLLAWIDHDGYGYCDHLEKSIVSILDEKNQTVFSCIMHERYNASCGHDKRRWAETIKSLLAATHNVDEYIAFCSQDELSDVDCKTIAQMYQHIANYAAALVWVERGLSNPYNVLSIRSYELEKMKRQLLVELGRSEEATSSAWMEFEQHPNQFGYEELMCYVPEAEQRTWHQRAMVAAENSTLSDQLELWRENNEIDLMIACIRQVADAELEDLSHYYTEPVASLLEQNYPMEAAKVYRALGMRTVNAGKSKYYDAALDHLQRARNCYIRAKDEKTWLALVDDIRRRHFRKKGFMMELEEIVSGDDRLHQPTFLQRAKERRDKLG